MLVFSKSQKVIKSMPGIKLVEMKRNRKNSDAAVLAVA